MIGLCIAAALIEMSRNGMDFKVDSDTSRIDPARSVFLRIELRTPPDRNAALPDLRDRVEARRLWRAAKRR